MENTTVEVKLRPGQVVVVFDIGNSIAGQSPWQEQANAIGQRLSQLCVKDFNSEAISGKTAQKDVLLRRLKMFDLLSIGMPISKAAIELDLTYKGKKKTGRRRQSAINPYLALMPKMMITAAYDDASEAYSLVYRHGYINLLRGDRGYVIRGTHFIPDKILDNNDDLQDDW
ncbi:MAG: hypothetical protein CVU24_03265 [Betaproteobacteria bacterium HGW-Betaproteobacteria-18]|nr:MAG: hypothetical protein CVU24_03265 [Betaproteobacteria bacterium HGW-Betaproteobacteria-18]